MGSATFKTFGYVGPTSNVRSSMDQEKNIQEMKAGFDESELKRKRIANRNMIQAQTRLVNAVKQQPRKRFIM